MDSGKALAGATVASILVDDLHPIDGPIAFDDPPKPGITTDDVIRVVGEEWDRAFGQNLSRQQRRKRARDMAKGLRKR